MASNTAIKTKFSRGIDLNSNTIANVNSIDGGGSTITINDNVLVGSGKSVNVSGQIVIQNTSPDLIFNDGDTTSDFKLTVDAGEFLIQQSNTTGGSFTNVMTVNTAGSFIFDNDVYVTGNLIVAGDQATLNVATLEVEDAAIVVNKNWDGSPADFEAGLIVDRGSASGGNVAILWRESAETFIFDSNTAVMEFVVNATSNSYILKVESGNTTYGDVVGVHGNLVIQQDTIYLGNIVLGGNVVPQFPANATNDFSVGNTSYYWQDSYIVNGRFSNSVTVGNSTVGNAEAFALRTYSNTNFLNSNGSNTGLVWENVAANATHDPAIFFNPTGNTFHVRYANGTSSELISEGLREERDFDDWKLRVNAGGTIGANISVTTGEVVTFANGAGLDVSRTDQQITYTLTAVTKAANVSINNSDGTVIQDVSLLVDNFGRVTTATFGSANLDSRYFQTLSNVLANGATSTTALTTGDHTIETQTPEIIFKDTSNNTDNISVLTFKTNDNTVKANVAYDSTNRYFRLQGANTTGGVVELAQIGEANTTIRRDTYVKGGLFVTGDITAFHSSDITIKTNLEPIENALDKVNSLTGYTFEYSDESKTIYPGRRAGLIAQEVQEILPEVVREREDGLLGVEYDKTVALLVEAIKELKEEIEELKRNRNCGCQD